MFNEPQNQAGEIFYANGQGVTWSQKRSPRDSRNWIIVRNDGLEAEKFTHEGVRITLPDGATIERDFMETPDGRANLYPLCPSDKSLHEVHRDVRGRLAECLDAHYPANKPLPDPHAYLYA